MSGHDDVLASAVQRLLATFRSEDAAQDLLGGTAVEGIVARDGLVQVTLDL